MRTSFFSIGASGSAGDLVCANSLRRIARLVASASICMVPILPLGVRGLSPRLLLSRHVFLANHPVPFWQLSDWGIPQLL